MSAAQAHTPLPWRAHRGENGQFSIVGADTHEGTWLIGKTISTHEIDAANADLIVRAVNSRADMLAALHAAVNWYTPPNDSGPFPLKHIVDAIAKAEGRS